MNSQDGRAGIFYSIAISMIALRTPAFLQEFMIVRQGTPVNQRVKGAAIGASAAYKAFKK